MRLSLESGGRHRRRRRRNRWLSAAAGQRPAVCRPRVHRRRVLSRTKPRSRQPACSTRWPSDVIADQSPRRDCVLLCTLVRGDCCQFQAQSRMLLPHTTVAHLTCPCRSTLMHSAVCCMYLPCSTVLRYRLNTFADWQLRDEGKCCISHYE